MTYECFDVSINNDIAHIVLSRPEKRNAMNTAFWRELPQIVKEIDDGCQARVIVISSTGPIFSAGIDLSMFGNEIGGISDKNDASYGADFYTNSVTPLQESFNALEECRIPVIAAIQGGCIGGGVDMVTACDMRFGTADSYIAIYEINVGMVADVGTFPRILNHMPEGVVRELAYTGRKMGADECKARGLYNEVYADHDAMMDAVMKLAGQIAAKPPLSVYGCKRIITYARDHDTKDTLDQIAVWNMSMLSSAEIMEAIQSQKEKRAGVFKPLPKRRKT